MVYYKHDNNRCVVYAVLKASLELRAMSFEKQLVAHSS